MRAAPAGPDDAFHDALGQISAPDWGTLKLAVRVRTSVASDWLMGDCAASLVVERANVARAGK